MVLQLAIQIPTNRALWLIAGLVFVGVVVLSVYAFSTSLKKFLRRNSELPSKEISVRAFRIPSDPTELSATLQSVIHRLKTQERELERLHREEKQRALQTEQLSEAVTRNMPTGLLLINSNGLITLANPAAQTVLANATLSYRRYDEALGKESHLTRLLTECLREGHTFQREEVEHFAPSGELRQLGVTVSPVLAPPAHLRGQQADAAPENITGALCLLSDLTELTALQKQMRLQESLALLGELSAGIAHEFKSSLATISGYAQMLRSDAASNEQASGAEKIVQETRALTHLVTEFLRFARPMEFSPTHVNLGTLVMRTVSELQAELPHIHISVEGRFEPVAGDEGLLRQALLNLARNAAEAPGLSNAEQVRISIFGEFDDSGTKPVQRIAVRDNGPGISETDLPRIFMPFYTTKSSGTGLGLAIVQKIAVQHNGTVTARNLPEGGAEFLLRLPIQQSASLQAVDSAVRSI